MMKQIIFSLILALFCFIGFAQEVGYDVINTYSKPIAEEKLTNANTMKDINPDYPSSWINEEDYMYTQITVKSEGENLIEKGSDENLTAEQKEILKKADQGSNIDIEVSYKSKNTVTNKVVFNTMNFSLSLVPEKEAEFEGGRENMLEYLKEMVMDKITSINHDAFEMAKVSFVVDEEGKPMQAQIVESSNAEKIDQLLLKVISKMPNWIPAESADGLKVKQKLELVVGTMIGC